MGYQTEEEKIKEEFSEIIREQLTENQFWKYVKNWIDADWVCEIMENWDILTKQKEIIKLKKQFKLN